MTTKKEQVNMLIKKIEETMETVTKEEFVQAFEAVVKSFNMLKKEMLAELEGIREKADKKLEKIGEMSTSELVKAQKEYLGKVEKALREQENGMNYIYDKVKQLRDGKDADERRIIDTVLEEIQLPEQKEFILSPFDVRDKLEMIQVEEEKLTIEAIKDLRKELDELKKIKTQPMRVGGGTSDIGVTHSLARIVRTEVPTGDIDGVNLTYTTSATINAVLSFGINGQIIHSNEYTVSGKTITFTTALPAQLSGTRYEIIYV